jgi:hypothetical protein
MSIDKNRNVWILEYPDGEVTISVNPEVTKQKKGEPLKITNMHLQSQPSLWFLPSFSASFCQL